MKIRFCAFLLSILASFELMAANDPASLEYVNLKTNLGNIVIKLDVARAPVSSKNFIDYVKAGHYDGLIFHRVIKGFMAQGGGFDENWNQRTTRAPIANEADNGLSNKRGTVAMARTADPYSATGQFFINYVDNAFLDFKSKSPQGWGYAVFGEVIAGMDVVDKMASIPTGRGGPMPTDVPQTMIVIEKATLSGTSSNGSGTNAPRPSDSKGIESLLK